MRRLSVLNATWGTANVLETRDRNSTMVGAPWMAPGVGTADPPVSLVHYRVSSLVLGAELTYTAIVAAAQDFAAQAG